MENLNAILRRIVTELFDLDPAIEPPAPRAEWPQWPKDSATQDGARLRVLSLNAWGLPVAPKISERAREIANAIQGDYDVVVLQEIWHRRERNLLIARGEKAGYHYYHYFQPAIGFPVPLGADSFGTGLLVLSKYPISTAMYHSFSLSGRPYALHEADFIANKGVGLLRIQTPVGQVDMYVTHLLANYNKLGQPGPGDRYIAHRVAQSYEMVQFIAATARSDLTLVCGDFNSPDDCVVLRIPRELHGLRDAFTDSNDHDGLTFATEDNKFSHGDHPMRMDYVLYKVAESQAKNDASWQLVSCDVFKGFFTDAKGNKCPLSDHFGVTAEFSFGSSHDPIKPCEQALGENSKETASPVTKPTHVKPCSTRTCIHCDSIKSKVEAGKRGADGLTRSVRCLQDVQLLFMEGRAIAALGRSAHLRRCALSLLLLVVIAAVQALGLFDMNTFSWLVVLALALHCLLEYILAFFFLTLECSTFTELANQVRLHLHAQQASDIVL